MTTLLKDKKIKLTLTEEQANILIESLLFSSSTNISSEWSEEHNNIMVDLAINVKNKLSDSSLNLKNLTYYDDEELISDVSQMIQQNFEITCFQIKTLESI
jgi:hypothetical protein